MHLDADTARAYVAHALRQMLAVADRLGDDLVNRRPLGPHTNAVAPLVVHCCGVAEFWLGHVALGRPTHRDRDAEFTATATVAELHGLVAATQARIDADVAALDAGPGTVDHPETHDLPGGGRTAAGVHLHLLEELYQHLGHMELAADALLAPADPT
jgi:hypothetical protein